MEQYNSCSWLIVASVDLPKSQFFGEDTTTWTLIIPATFLLVFDVVEDKFAFHIFPLPNGESHQSASIWFLLAFFNPSSIPYCSIACWLTLSPAFLLQVIENQSSGSAVWRSANFLHSWTHLTPVVGPVVGPVFQLTFCNLQWAKGLPFSNTEQSKNRRLIFLAECTIVYRT